VLFGHSGGGPTMSFYQAGGRERSGYCKDPKALAPCTEDLSGFPRADGIVFADAHPGQPVNVLRSMLPVSSEASPPTAPLIAELDPLSPANGYNPNGASRYTDEFLKRYLAAQAKRMNATIDEAIRRLDALKSNRTDIPTTTFWSCRARATPARGRPAHLHEPVRSRHRVDEQHAAPAEAAEERRHGRHRNSEKRHRAGPEDRADRALPSAWEHASSRCVRS
jgi:hypothetical protein